MEKSRIQINNIAKIQFDITSDYIGPASYWNQVRFNKIEWIIPIVLILAHCDLVTLYDYMD